MKALLKKVLPPTVYGHAGGVYRRVRHLGWQRRCPLCGGRFRAFLPLGRGYYERPDALCPVCLSLERHRLIWLFLQAKTDLPAGGLKLLHFAPEKCLADRLRKVPYINYVTADLEFGRGDLVMDVTSIPCKEGSYDAVLCVHVLEHVVDDRGALREFFRILKPGGWAIIHVPLEEPGRYYGLWRDGPGPVGTYFDAYGRRIATFENPAALTWEDREVYYGQGDHVRIYGLDYPARLRGAGFLVAEETVVEQSDAATMKKYGLTSERIYFCRKPAAVDPSL